VQRLHIGTSAAGHATVAPLKAPLRWLATWQDWSDEPVPSPGQRFDVTRGCGGIAQSRADLVYRLRETLVEIDERSVRPQSRTQLASSHDLAWLLEQGRQDLERLGFQVDPDATFPQFTRIPIDRENTKTDLFVPWWHFCREFNRAVRRRTGGNKQNNRRAFKQLERELFFDEK
jgi:hypothetical protein